MRVLFILSLLFLSSHIVAQDVVMQNVTVNRCAPDRFYDSGGEFGNYGNNENFVTTICPQNTGDFIILDFISFSTQLNLDIMTIYDGDNTSASIIGSFSGVASPGTISASDTNPTGCLTIAFESNASGNTTGWQAEILCAAPCQDIDAIITTTNPAANNTGVISILPGDSVTFDGSVIFSEDDSNATYNWDFGDGNTAIGLNVVNTFDNSGTYTVTFTAQDDNPQECRDSDTITVFVLGPNLVVDDTTFTPEELIQDVLINSPCATVSNIISSTGIDFSPSEPNGIGYFISNGTSFPFEDGLLLTSGKASDARGPNNINMSDGSVGIWPGDADLNAELGISSNNASFIQFDFTPLANSISFEFLMASEEYNMGTFECDFSDAFAFLLTDSNGVTTNLAVLPGTTIPILVTNIHLANTACAAVNPEYFGGYTPTNGPPTSFDGRTTVFTAQAPVNPGENYTIKLVIADDGDAAQDSGVFIKAGSFDLGGDLGDDITIDSGNASCDGSSIRLNTKVPTANHTWYYNGVEIPGETSSTIDVTDPGLYSVDIVFSGVCQSSDEILVEFKANPLLEANPNDINSCSTTGSSNFDLTQNDAIILGSQNASEFNIEYFNSQADADLDVNAISNPSDYPGSDGEIIIVRLEDTATQTCFVTASFTLNIALSVASPVDDIIRCDDASNDEVEQFDLSIQTPIVLGSLSSSDYVVTYHNSIDDAEASANALATLYSNTENPQTIFIRVESVANGACFETTSFNLIVDPLPVIPNIPPYELCDDDSDGDNTNGFTEFDLTSLNGTVINGQIDLVVSYYETQLDAENNTNPVIDANTYTNTSVNSQTIYIRLEDTISNCYSTSNFELIVHPIPEAAEATLFQCDEDGIPDGLTTYNLSEAEESILVSGNVSDFQFSYHLSLADATSNINEQNSISYSNITNPQIIFVRISNVVTGCVNFSELTLMTSVTDITDIQLEECDDNSDGLTAFNLNDASNIILLGLPPGSDINYYISESDALLELNPLPIIYTNVVPFSQNIYARAENANNCFGIGFVNLIVNPLPIIGNLADVELCSDTPNVTDIDLSQFDGEVLSGQNAADYNVAYFESDSDAISNINPLSSPYTTVSNPQSIYARIENNNTECFTTSSFNVVINTNPPLSTPTPLEVCDDGMADDFTVIDLTIKDQEISGGNVDYLVSYYETQSDADSQTNALVSPYTNTSNPQTIYVRVEDNTTSCYSTTTLDLVVEQAPVAFDPSPLTYCDPDNDGFGLFTLTDADAQITGGAAGLSVSYHETLVNAQTNANAIDTSADYGNIVIDTQTLYARVESATIATDCSTIVELELIVFPTPEVPTDLPEYVQCDVDGDGITQFDLTIKNAEILGSQSTTDYTVSYYTSAADAASGNNAIANVGNYSNATNPQTIYVRVEGNANGCDTLGEFTLRVDLPPVAIQPTPLEECDDLGESPGDEFTVFDLTQKDNEITGGDAGLSVSYYETDADSQADTNAIADPTQYTNTSVGGAASNPQTLYVRVTDTDTGCTDLTTLTIRVLPNPTPTPSDMLDELVLCDDTNAGDGVEAFDLTSNEVLILNGEAGVTATYHESAADADAGQNAIADPTQYINTVSPEQTIYVRVTNDTTGCYALVDFDLRVDPLPSVVAVTDFVYCELNTDGFYAFDLTEKDTEVLAGQDPTLYTVSYHESQADADALTNALISPYTNTSNPQQIFVAITNTATGCSVSSQRFNIEVQEAAQANSDQQAIVYEQCDDEMETDGNPSNDSVQFDLSTQNTEVLDGQDPADYTVSYYATQIDANLGVNPLPLLYENLFNPQIIYSRVDNNVTSCYAVTELTLQVNPLPEFSLETQYVLCTDTNGTAVVGPPLIDTGLSETNYSFQWSLNGTTLAGETGSSLTATQSGMYMVEVTDTTTSTVTSCSSTQSTEVIESSPPSVEVTVVSQAFANNHIIEAVAIGIGVYEYSLDGGPWQQSGVFSNVSPGIHEVTARDRQGCGLASDDVLVMDYPLYFTPNGDGRHDTWKITGMDSQPSAKIYIFDRYGKLLKQLSPTGEGWNGTYNGTLMPNSDYWFTVTYTEPSTGEQKELSAHFTLKR